MENYVCQVPLVLKYYQGPRVLPSSQTTTLESFFRYQFNRARPCPSVYSVHYLDFSNTGYCYGVSTDSSIPGRRIVLMANAH